MQIVVKLVVKMKKVNNKMDRSTMTLVKVNLIFTELCLNKHYSSSAYSKFVYIMLDVSYII